MPVPGPVALAVVVVAILAPACHGTHTITAMLSGHRDVSVLEVSGVILFPVAKAPAPEPTKHNVSAMLSRHGCDRFGRLVTETGDAAAIYEQSIRDGLTIFCPEDKAVEALQPVLSRAAADCTTAWWGTTPSRRFRPTVMISSRWPPSTTSGGYYGCAECFVDGSIIQVSAAHGVARVTRFLIDVNHNAVYSINEILLPFNVAAPPPEDLPPVSAHHVPSYCCY